MPFEVALGSSKVNVRNSQLQRDRATGVESAASYLVLCPVAPTRLWDRVGSDIASAFETELTGKSADSASFEAGIAAARASIARLCGQLIEPHVTLDARIGAVFTDGDTLRVALTEGVRLYRARNGLPERLFGKAERPAGLASGALFSAAERSQPGELFILGTREVFGVRSIGNLAAALARGAAPSAGHVCDALMAPCRDAGVGAAAVIVRAL